MLRKLRKMLKQQEGFTLVELAIVVVILGILAGVGIQQYGRVQERARESAHEANVKIIRSATQMYLMMENEPKPQNGKLAIELADVVEAGYLDAVPADPWGGENVYEIGISKAAQGGDLAGYKITVKLGDLADPAPEGNGV